MPDAAGSRGHLPGSRDRACGQVLQQMRGKAVPQRGRRRRLVDPGRLRGLMASAGKLTRGDRLQRITTHRLKPTTINGPLTPSRRQQNESTATAESLRGIRGEATARSSNRPVAGLADKRRFRRSCSGSGGIEGGSDYRERRRYFVAKSRCTQFARSRAGKVLELKTNSEGE